MLQFDSILSNLKEITARHDSDSDSDERPEVPKPAIKKTKKKKKTTHEEPKASKKSKFKRKKQSSSSAESDADVERVDKEKSSGKRNSSAAKAATHVGRYHKRENAKRVRGYSSGDLAAILGASSVSDDKVQAMDYVPATAQEIRAVHTQEDSDASSAGHVSGSDADDEATDFASSSRNKDPVDQITKSWWSGVFVRAGRVGSSKRELHKRKPGRVVESDDARQKAAGFNEHDQENLYTQVHQGATQGKQGLGRADAPKKVAGARWAGTKTKLGSDSEHEEWKDRLNDREDSSNKESELEDAVNDEAVVVYASKKEVADGQLGCRKVLIGGVSKEGDQDKNRKPVSKVSGESSAGKVHWKKIARRVLKEAPKRKMKARLLHMRVLEAAGLDACGRKDEKNSEKILIKRLHSFPDLFEVTEKFVRLL
ncbi:hypothetical protein CEUSTIGMA_g643.t1 [Chlamydomonas eustigma]|uniref:Cell growth-regulating nucleolar protein-like winged helix domain-containing protein n=1 Tax=Chlamydomonas eustigma TaxID=1157962 RepID=A0A250WRL7_9CHLO|nr:hypothetical protein CEUSTIGMA_g643.t1 [Chlamydomonas eustigma]|eukprot:GAX73190.1 hypothetical protein CEUSTIGMA_g643.t1 [Chlamydomonas eustigma]